MTDFDPDLYAHGADQLRKERKENGWCEHDQPPEHCRKCHPELPPWCPHGRLPDQCQYCREDREVGLTALSGVRCRVVVPSAFKGREPYTWRMTPIGPAEVASWLFIDNEDPEPGYTVVLPLNSILEISALEPGE